MKPNPTREQEYREEAKRLAQLPLEDQRAIVAWHRDIAADAKLPKGDRDAARERAAALERLLKLAGRKRRK